MLLKAKKRLVRKESKKRLAAVFWIRLKTSLEVDGRLCPSLYCWIPFISLRIKIFKESQELMLVEQRRDANEKSFVKSAVQNPLWRILNPHTCTLFSFSNDDEEKSRYI